MKLDIIFHYEVNENTGEIKYIGKDEITVDTSETPKKASAKKSSTVKIDTNTEPIVTLDSNKLILSQGAVDLLQVCEDCRVDIKYTKKGNQSVPIIGTDSAFGTKAGNRLSKSNTVSYRGAANSKLSTYGTKFTLEPTKDTGIYYLVGDGANITPEVPEDISNVLEELSTLLDDEDVQKFDFTL